MRSGFYRYLQHLQQQRDRLLLIFVTGRDLGFIRGLCDDPAFPRPGDVGTAIVHNMDNVYHSPHPGVAGI